MEHGKRYSKSRAIAEFGSESNGAAVEFDAVLDDHQAEAGAGLFGDVGATVKCLKKMGMIFFGYADALIDDLENQGVSLSVDGKAYI